MAEKKRKKAGRPKKVSKITQSVEKKEIIKKDTPVMECVSDIEDKLLKLKRKVLKGMGKEEDPTKVYVPIDPTTGEPKYETRWMDDTHRKVKGGLGNWVCPSHQDLDRLGIKLSNNPLIEYTKKGNDTRVFLQDMYLAIRPIEVQKYERKRINEKSTRLLNSAENENLAAKIESELGHKDFCKVMDAITTIKRRR